MACGACSRRTLSGFIDSLLVGSTTPARLRRARPLHNVHTTMTRVAAGRKSLHTGPIRPLHSILPEATQTDDAHIPFSQDMVPHSSEIASLESVPRPFTRPPVPTSLDLEAEPDISLSQEMQDSLNLISNDVSAIANSPQARPGRDSHNNSDDRRSKGRVARKERNREALAARRRAKNNPGTQATSSSTEVEDDLPGVDFQSGDALKTDTASSTEAATKKTSTQQHPKDKEYPSEKPKPEPWQIQKAALKKKFKDDNWNPRKRLSPEALEGIRALHAQYPDRFSTPALADQFKISPEAIRRILKSKWRPNEAEEERRLQRWDKRGERIWTSKVVEGVHPPKRWREMGIGSGPRRKAQDRSSQGYVTARASIGDR